MVVNIKKTKEKRARALKCLDAHLKSPTSDGIQQKTREDNQRDHDRHNSAQPVWKVSGRHVTCAGHNNKVGAQLSAQNK